MKNIKLTRVENTHKDIDRLMADADVLEIWWRGHYLAIKSTHEGTLVSHGKLDDSGKYYDQSDLRVYHDAEWPDKASVMITQDYDDALEIHLYNDHNGLHSRMFYDEPHALHLLAMNSDTEEFDPLHPLFTIDKEDV